MTADESKGLPRGARVYWRGDSDDSGTIAETNWNAVTIFWKNGHTAIVHHGDMREVQLRPNSVVVRGRCLCGLVNSD